MRRLDLRFDFSKRRFSTPCTHLGYFFAADENAFYARKIWVFHNLVICGVELGCQGSSSVDSSVRDDRGFDKDSVRRRLLPKWRLHSRPVP
jgi:hypothetical protein